MGSELHERASVTKTTPRQRVGYARWVGAWGLSVGIAVLVGILGLTAKGVSWQALGAVAVMLVLGFAPLLFLSCLGVWAVPSISRYAGWAGPLVAWLLAPLAVLVLAQAAGSRGFPGWGMIYAVALLPALLMVGCYGLLRWLRGPLRSAGGAIA